MSDMRINRTQGECPATDVAAKRQQNRTGASFADLLKSVAPTVDADNTQTQRTASDSPVPAAHIYLRDTSGWLGKVSAPGLTPSSVQSSAIVLEKLEGETEAAWERRCISFEVARRWQVDSRAWKAESDGMDVFDGMLYCSEKATEWVTDLMENEPAMFREWLEQEQWHIRESGLDNAILPEGLTKDDMSRWMEKDVLEYL